MKNRTALFIAPFLFGLLSLGCAEDVESENVKTDGMYANFEAVASGNGSTRVVAELKVGGRNSNTYVELTGDDELVASTGDESVQLKHVSSGDHHWYEKTFDTDADGTEFDIAFNRADGEESAPDSSVVLPPPFAVSLTGAKSGDDIQRGTDIEVTWDTEYSGNMHWDVEGICIDNADGSVDDTGSLIIEVAASSTGEGDECEVTVTLERIKEGSVDPAYGEGGEFQGIQRRAIKFNSTPADDELDGMGGSGM